MFCILVGIHPHSSTLREVVQQIKSLNSEDVDWQEFSSAMDEGRMTFLALAWTCASPDALRDAVQLQVDDLNVTCEMWACSPAPLPLRPSTGYDLTFNPRRIEDACKKIREWGILIQSGILDTAGVDYIRGSVDDAIQNTEISLRTNRPQLKIGQDVMFFKEIASRNLERFDLRLSDAKVISFVKGFIVSNSSVSSLLEQTLGSSSEIDFDISVVYSKPGACPQNWHADGAHQKGANDAGWTKDGWKTLLADPYALCLFIPLIDLNTQVGFTQFWPGSHRHRELAGFGKVAELAEATADGICKAGDGVWYDYRLLHRGMPNQSSAIRPILQIVFKKKWYVEQANYGSESIIPN